MGCYGSQNANEFKKGIDNYTCNRVGNWCRGVIMSLTSIALPTDSK